MKVLILTAGYGEGHNSAARGLQTALLRSGAGDEVECHDLFAETYGWFNEWVRRAYLTLINRWPRSWGRVYDWLDRKNDFHSDFRRMPALRRNLEDLLERFRPSIIVSVFPAYPYLLEPLLIHRPAYSIAVVTDSITVNAIWYRSGADFFILPNEESAAVLRTAGIPEAKIKALGFPVDPRFADLPPRPAPSLIDRPRVLYMINAGTKLAPLTARMLSELDIQLSVTVGRNETLRQRIADAVPPEKVKIIGWCTNLPELLGQNHLLIGKAGGATVQEAIAAACPMIVNHIVSGQEEGNARLLMETGSGVVAKSPAEIVECVKEMFAHDAALWQTKAHNVAQISRPRAALEIADFLHRLPSR